MGSEKRVLCCFYIYPRLTEGYNNRYDAGWICAQRRAARGLGSLQSVFGVKEHEVELPDLPLIVDDDTNVKRDGENVHSLIVDAYLK
jgi:hypothetical protein